MSECRYFRVQGRVQGVFFRASARQKAQTLQLTGWIRNRGDGSVEGLACGDAATLDAFGEWLWKGPAEARVTQAEMQPSEDTPPTSFDIL